MEKGNEYLEKGSIGKLLFKLALPTVVAQFINLLYNIVDRMYVGRIPGSGSMALAGLGITFPILIFISAFAMLFGMGGASRAAIAMGAKETEKAEKYLGNSFLMLLITSFVLTIVFYVFNKPILFAFGASSQTISYASEYVKIYVVGTVFVQMALGLNAFITNQGFAKTSMATVVIGAVINIALDPILIFGFNMGVKGAATATVISQAVSAVWVIWFLTGRKTVLKLRMKNMKIEKGIIIPIITLGVSPFVMQATECLIQLTFNNGMLKYGGDMYVALMSVLFSLMQVIWMPMQGVAQGAQPIIGYNFGAKNYDRVKKTFRLLFTVNIIYSLVFVGTVIAFPKMFLSIFTNDKELINMGVVYMQVFFAGMSIAGAQSACQQTFLALGEAKISAFLALLRKVILILPLALILPRIAGLGVWGLVLSEPISDVIAVMTTTIMFRIRSKKFFKPAQSA